MTAFGLPSSGSSGEWDRLPEIRAGLRAQIDCLARRLLGNPVGGGRSTRTLQFGNRSGSLHVEIGGPKQGLWFDYSEGVGGDGLALIQHVNGGTFPDAVAWAANWLGIDIGQPMPAPDPVRAVALESERERRRIAAAAQEAHDAARRVQTAQRWWCRRQPLAGTVGATYFASRGIVEPVDGWPECVAFVPAVSVEFTDKNPEGLELRREVTCAGAVVVAATNEAGDVCGVQRIYVGQDGRNIRDWSGRKVKLTNGVLSGNGAVVRLRVR